MFHHMRRLVAVAILAASPGGVLAAQQAATVSGTVKNGTGAPISDIAVVLDGMGLGAQTRSDGRYTITVPGAQARGQSVRIVARGIGYKSSGYVVTLNQGGTVTQDFVLDVSPLRLSEVVVTGSGTSTVREKLGNVVTSVKSEDIKKAAEPNLVNALAAKATGIEVTSSAGDPGAGTGIVIRGFKTIEGNGQPLFVVDGVPIDNSTIPSEDAGAEVAYANRAIDINPNDIESVEILKGAAAASIYGLRAANGVILITTKSGKAGATRVSFTTQATLDEVNRVIPLQREYGRGRGGAALPCGTDNVSCFLRSWGPKLAAGTETFDHAREVFRNGSMFDNNLQVSGGDANRNFFMSVGWLDQTGIAKGPNSSLDRKSVRLKGSQNLNPTLKVGANIMYTDLSQAALQKGNNLNGLMLGATRQPPEFNPFPYKTADGWQRAWAIPSVTAPGVYQTFDNPFWVAYEQRNSSKVGRSIGSVNLDWNPKAWFSLNYSLGGDYGNEARIIGLPPYSSGDAVTGQLYQATNTTFIVDHNLLATLRKDFGRNINTRVVMGQNLNSTDFRSLQVKGTGYISPSLFTLNNIVSTNLQPQNFESRVNIAGYFAQTEVDLWEQLYLSAGIRADQSSTLSKENRTAYFPKASVAWNITNFLGNRTEKGTLSYLKARSSYGQVGRQPGVYQILTNFSSGTGAFAFGGGSTNPSQGGTGGLYTGGTLGDPNLKFERTAETEAGLDFGFLDQRIDGTVTWYNALSTDVIFGIPVAPSSGFGLTATNGAKVRNTGWEVSLNGRLVETKNLTWNLGANFTRNRNKLLELQGAEFVGLTGGFGVSAAVKGHPLGTFYGDDFVRCRAGDSYEGMAEGPSAAEMAALCAGKPEGALYINANGFPEYDGRNKVLGDPNPNYMLNIRTGVTLFKKLTLSALVDIKNGGQVWNGTRLALQSYGTHINTAQRGNSYTFGVDVPGMPKASTVGPGAGKQVVVGESWWRTGLGNNFNGPTSQGVESGGFTRLREISASYSFDGRWVRNTFNASSIDMRIAGRNLGLWTKYTGIDPETNLTGPIGVGRGQDYFNSPQTRSLVISFQYNR